MVNLIDGGNEMVNLIDGGNEMVNPVWLEVAK